jgi:hypothetical protein
MYSKMKSAFRQEGVIKSLLGGAERREGVKSVLLGGAERREGVKSVLLGGAGRREGVKSVLLLCAAGMVEENPFYSSAQHRATEFKRNKCPLRVSAREATKIK